jgi:MFS family permease
VGIVSATRAWRARTSTAFYGWWVLAGAMAVNALGGGIQSYGFSVFFLPLRDSLGISSASASLIFSLSRAEGAIEGPLIGYLIDRFGARVMIAVGASVMATGYILLAGADSYVMVLIIYLGVISVGFNCGFGHATLALVNSWFIRRRSFAMALATSAFSLGGAIVAPLLGVAVAAFGWRTAAALAGVWIFALLIPILLVIRRSPESVGLRPDGDDVPPPAPASSEAVTVAPPDDQEFTVKEAMRSSTYWFFVLATTMRVTIGTAMTVHFIAIMDWKGIDETVAAGMLGVFALISVPLRIFMGGLGDRYSKAALLSLTLAVGAGSLIFLNYASGYIALFVFLVVFAWVESNPALNWAMVGDFFGRNRFATIRGSMSFFYGWGQMATPFLAGLIWDRTDSYSLVLWIFAVMWIIGAVIFAVLRPPRRKPVPALAN